MAAAICADVADYCSAAFSMIEAGYHKVLVYTGGIKEWIAVGAPLRKRHA